jgi:hypothetical protein
VVGTYTPGRHAVSLMNTCIHIRQYMSSTHLAPPTDDASTAHASTANDNGSSCCQALYIAVTLTLLTHIIQLQSKANYND